MKTILSSFLLILAANLFAEGYKVGDQAADLVYKSYGATNTPHAFVLNKDGKGNLVVKYIGAIDDNYQDASSVKKPYLENAVKALLSGKDPETS
jgi:hypothetical protein